MRRKVWPRVGNLHDTFKSADHQRQYDTMAELLKILSNVGFAPWVSVLKSAASNSQIIDAQQADLFTL